MENTTWNLQMNIMNEKLHLQPGLGYIGLWYQDLRGGGILHSKPLPYVCNKNGNVLCRKSDIVRKTIQTSDQEKQW